ncbi:thiamine pyrophosphokinase [Pelomyxa schiedti]|nr:thiamine pyrophosphokinase [Pelomyxa schiedti]
MRSGDSSAAVLGDRHLWLPRFAVGTSLGGVGGGSGGSGCYAAAIALNTTLPPFFACVWLSAKLRICADGGANRVVEFFKHRQEDPSMYYPHCIIGDLDSVTKETIEFFSPFGSQVVHVEDQDTDDITKALNYTFEKLTSSHSSNKHDIAVLGPLGHSVSQELANLNALFLFQSVPNVEITFMSKYNVVWLISPGNTILHCPVNSKCGIMPLSCRCDRAHTAGLKWELDGPLEFGHLISSSNVTTSDCVTITVSHPVLWLFDLLP